MAPTEATLNLIAHLFPPEQRARVAEILEHECGNNLPFLEDADANALERFHFAALRLSKGTLEGLREAVALAKLDWRDLLVAAHFAEAPDAHKSWRAPRRFRRRRRKAAHDPS